MCGSGVVVSVKNDTEVPIEYCVHATAILRSFPAWLGLRQYFRKAATCPMPWMEYNERKLAPPRFAGP